MNPNYVQDEYLELESQDECSVYSSDSDYEE
jgi:hypothetical protein